jgi:hypothetical protein
MSRQARPPTPRSAWLGTGVRPSRSLRGFGSLGLRRKSGMRGFDWLVWLVIAVGVGALMFIVVISVRMLFF